MKGSPIRKAKASDVEFVAEMMYQSMLPGVGSGIFDAALEGTGVGPLQFHQALLLAGTNNWGQLDDVLIIDDDQNLPAGAMGSFLSDMKDLRPLTAEGVDSVAKRLEWSADTARGFFKRYVSFFGMFGQSPTLVQPAPYVLEYTAIRSDMRGRGLHAQLVRAHIERAREAGHASVGHTAVLGNYPVLRSLQKLGFRVHVTLEPDRFRGLFPGLSRLVLDIK